MKVLLQRVSEAKVTVDGVDIGAIGRGIVLLVGFTHQDQAAALPAMVEKLVNLRIFPDERDRLHYSLTDIDGEILLVPQFTLYADTRKGRRPDFGAAMAPAEAQALFDHFLELFEGRVPRRTAAGRFGADMKVSLINDGPLTLEFEV